MGIVPGCAKATVGGEQGDADDSQPIGTAPAVLPPCAALLLLLLLLTGCMWCGVVCCGLLTVLARFEVEENQLAEEEMERLRLVRYDPVVYCYELQLHPSVHRRGLGKRLMQMLELVVSHGCRWLHHSAAARPAPEAMLKARLCITGWAQQWRGPSR